MPIGWTFVFAALVIGLLSNKRMYRPPLDLRMLEATRSIVTAGHRGGDNDRAPGLLTEASAVAEEAIEPWLLPPRSCSPGRFWLISSERRASRKGEAGQRALIVGAGNVGRLVSKRLSSIPRWD